MAFKSMEQYDDDRYSGMFRLINDGDYEDVVIMYQSRSDVLEADVHYLKSSDFSGYVHCCGSDCPACKKGIRVQPKLFVPVYVISKKQILYFDRSTRFMSVLDNDVFRNYPNPSEYVFRITRHGAANSVDTTYSIVAVGKNNFAPYAQILADLHTSMPADYDQICKDYDRSRVEGIANNAANSSANTDYQSQYNAQPRGAAAPMPEPSVPQASVPTPVYNQPDASLPPVDGLGSDDDGEIGDAPNF